MQNTLFHALEQQFWQHVSTQDQAFSPAVHAFLSPVTAAAHFNLLFAQKNASQADIEQGLDWFKQQQKNSLLVVDTTLLPTLSDTIAQYNLVDDGQTTAMQLDLTTWQNRLDPIHDMALLTESLSDWSTPLLTAFGEPPEQSGQLDTLVTEQYQSAHETALQQHAPLHHFVLKVDGQPVSCLTLTLSEQGARLDDIGTALPHQGQGYASHLLEYALLFAKEQGVQTCYLEASSSGLSLYQKQGFTALFNYHYFYHAV